MAIASALFLAQATWAGAQTAPSGSGTAGSAATPAPNTNLPPSSAGQSTPPPTTQGPAGTSSSGTVGQSPRASKLDVDDPKSDPVVQQTEKEVSRRIKSICKGC